MSGVDFLTSLSALLLPRQFQTYKEMCVFSRSNHGRVPHVTQIYSDLILLALNGLWNEFGDPTSMEWWWKNGITLSYYLRFSWIWRLLAPAFRIPAKAHQGVSVVEYMGTREVESLVCPNAGKLTQYNRM